MGTEQAAGGGAQSLDVPALPAVVVDQAAATSRAASLTGSVQGQGQANGAGDTGNSRPGTAKEGEGTAKMDTDPVPSAKAGAEKAGSDGVAAAGGATDDDVEMNDAPTTHSDTHANTNNPESNPDPSAPAAADPPQLAPLPSSLGQPQHAPTSDLDLDLGPVAARPVVDPTCSFPGGFPIDVEFEASKLPLDVAVFNSARAAGGDEKIRKYLQAVLVIGGTSMVPGMAHALESR
jgi:actin-related protein 8